MSEGCLYLVDATAFCYRAFYALQGLSTAGGMPTNAVYGFVTILQKLLKKYQPSAMAVCFDVSRETFRSKRFAEYKMQRAPMPEGLSPQIPVIKEVVAAYGLKVCEKEGFEADDLIATLARAGRDAGRDVVIVSSDKDILQLVNPQCRVFNPYKDGGIEIDAAGVESIMGVAPEKVCDVLALMGDAADNIPGVPGVGEKTAVKLVKEYGSVEALYGQLDRVVSEKLRASLSSHREQVVLAKELVRLDEHVPLEWGLPQLKVEPADTALLFELFSRLEFKSLVKGLALPAKPAPTQEAVRVCAPCDLPKESSALVLAADPKYQAVFLIEGKPCAADAAEGVVSRELREMLASPLVAKVGHDLKSLKVALARKGIALEGVSFDTMLAGYVLNPAMNAASLGELAWEYLQEQTSPSDPPAELALIAKLRPKLQERLTRDGLDTLFSEVEMPLIDVLAAMETEGIALNTALLAELSRSLEQDLAVLIENIYGISGRQFNINSPLQLRQVLFEELKLPVIKRSKTGPSTDEEVLSQLAAQHPLPQQLLQYRQLTKLKNTYIDTLPQMVDPATGRVHTSFNQAGTETGRLSSRNPNLQNLPIKTPLGGKIRQAVVAFSPGDVLVSFDYSQIELRILAHLSQDETLCRAFHEGKDIHKATAALIHGIGEDEVTDAMRTLAKRVNFGIIYGLTSYGLARDLDIPVGQAQAFIDAYFARYPSVKGYLHSQVERARRDGFVATIKGRRRYIPEISNRNQGIRQFAERQAVNAPIQGSASDVIKMAMIAVYRWMRGKGCASRMMLQVHDELLFNMPSAEAKECIPEVRRLMEGVCALSVPLCVSVKQGPNWLEMEDVA
jgi:DNA polymerase I